MDLKMHDDIIFHTHEAVKNNPISKTTAMPPIKLSSHDDSGG